MVFCWRLTGKAGYKICLSVCLLACFFLSLCLFAFSRQWVWLTQPKVNMAHEGQPPISRVLYPDATPTTALGKTLGGWVGLQPLYSATNAIHIIVYCAARDPSSSCRRERGKKNEGCECTQKPFGPFPLPLHADSLCNGPCAP